MGTGQFDPQPEHENFSCGLRRRMFSLRAPYQQTEIVSLAECLDREIRDRAPSNEYRSRDIVASGIEKDIGSAPLRHCATAL